ncbi:uncharacterized protein LOC112464850 [Temnothorax curvispinosus]|uniref:Uncharacterized protein LOC112464850 n=1 Tax=Temnothorax curvispinosus TaxID=300111 RepID=A0A6J1QYT9_9HYME|nr:uncharacterized protein LOC112464850 [Temnothorax curvispinosus]
MDKTSNAKEKTKTSRAKVDEATMKAAVFQVVKGNQSIRSTAKSFNINHMTLSRWVTKYKEATDEHKLTMKFVPNYQIHLIFPANIEEDLETYLLTASKMHHGLTRKQVLELAYQLAVVNKIDCPKSWHEKKAAGYDWFYSYMKRHPALSLRKPEATSMTRSTSFSCHTVNIFFDNLENCFKQLGDQISPSVIYNLDETALTTVHNPPNIIAKKGQKQIGQITSGERGILVTACCFISAGGNSIPPFMVFPRKNFKDHMIYGAPPGTVGSGSLTGWMNGEIFLDVLKHFQRHSRTSPQNKVLLIMDNHESHHD